MRSLRLQLLISHLVLVLVLGAVMSHAITRFFSLGHAVERVLEGNFKSIVAAGQMREGVTEQESAINLFLAGETAGGRAAFSRTLPHFRTALAWAHDAINEPGEDKIVNAIARNSALFQTDAFRLLAAPVKVRNQEPVYLANLQIEFSKLNDSIAELETLNQKSIVRDNERAREEAQRAAINSLWFTAGALLLAILLTVWLSSKILRPLSNLANLADEIGSGNLEATLSYRRNDEIGAVANAFNSMAQNLSEARETQTRRLHRAEQMSDAALEQLYDPVVVTDAKGRIVYLNQAAQGLFGPSPATPRTPVIEHIGDQRIVRAIENAIEQGRVSASEDETSLVPIKVGDADRTYRLRASPMRDDSGRLLGSVAVLEDITHMRVLDRLKTEFIGVASHELRTPVTSLLLSVQLLEEGAVGPLTEDQRQIVEAQKHDLERLENLMRELLDITRLEAGTSPPRFEFVPAQDLVKSAVQSTANHAKKKRVTLDVQVEPGLQPVRADRSQIGRVLTNLVTNAVRHTPAGGTITVRATGAGNQVTFTVADTGEGVPKEYQSRIFERFVQVPGATQGGAGLGLSIARTIVKAHGGEMWVESEVGKGAAFSFTLQSDSHASGGEKAV